MGYFCLGCRGCCKDFSSFKAEFIKIFDCSALGNEALWLLSGETFGGGFYHRVSHSCCIKWNDTALVARFTEGLEDEIKDEMYAHKFPEHLDELVELAIHLDNRRDLRRRVDAVSAFSVSDAPVHSPALKPMQLVRCCLSTEEKQHCLSKGLCLYCSIWTFCFLSGKSQRSLVSKGVLASVTSTTPSTGPCSMLPVSVTYEGAVHQLSAFIDSGAKGDFVFIEIYSVSLLSLLLML